MPSRCAGSSPSGCPGHRARRPAPGPGWPSSERQAPPCRQPRTPAPTGSRWCWRTRRPGSPRDRPSCSTRPPGSSAARRSPRPPRERAGELTIQRSSDANGADERQRGGRVTDDIAPVRSTGIGSWPGNDMADAIKIAFAESPDLPYLPELPAGGAYAGLVGRSTALLAGLAVDLQPAGWRLADTSSREHRLAVSTLRSDLDQLEEQAQGYAGPVKYAVAGPWTLAACVERPRGDRVLADRGARRDLGQSLAEGVAELVAEMRRRLPEAVPVMQLDEPMLPAVLAGGVATA